MSYLSRAAFRSALLCLSLVASSAVAQNIAWGVGGPNSRNADINAVFQMMKTRGLKDYRFGVNVTKDSEPYIASVLQDMIAAAKPNGITLRPIIFTSFQYGDPTDAGLYPAGDNAALYSQGYNRAHSIVSQFQNDIQNWELGNEINLRQTDVNGKKLYGSGWTAAEFDTPLMNQWASLLKGMSDAIDSINTSRQVPIRRALNTTSTMFGFLDFMASKGVNFEIISYHYYEKYGVNPHNYWGGTKPDYDLFKELGKRNRAVVFNEINAGEIYLADYENTAGQPETEAGFKSLNASFNYLATQTDARLEAVNVYELLDEPAKTAPENHFGALYDLNQPKITLYLLTHFAGGLLSTSEHQALLDRGFIPDRSQARSVPSTKRDLHR